jgi:hypothetical protein
MDEDEQAAAIVSGFMKNTDYVAPAEPVRRSKRTRSDEKPAAKRPKK